MGRRVGESKIEAEHGADDDRIDGDGEGDGDADGGDDDDDGDDGGDERSSLQSRCFLLLIPFSLSLTSLAM